MTSRVDFGWKPTTAAIFVGIRHVGVNAPHRFSQKPPLKSQIQMRYALRHSHISGSQGHMHLPEAASVIGRENQVSDARAARYPAPKPACPCDLSLP